LTVTTLNRQTIASLPDGEGLYWDTGLRGFGYLCRRNASGAIRKSFIIQYRNAEGRQRKLKLGDANKLNVDQARKKAERCFAEILLGIDPQGVKEQERIEAARLTFAQAVEKYLAAKATELRPTSLKLASLYLQNPRYFPLAKKPLHKIERADVAAHLDRINSESGAPTASRARAHISALFTWCLRRGHCNENPVIATEEPKGSDARERVLSGDELKAVWNACGDDDYGRIVRLLILTGCRREEIGGLKWSEVDLKAGTITIPAGRSKNHREHVLTLPSVALDILRSCPRREGREHVFGTRGEGFVTWTYGKRALLKTSKTSGWRLHDLRHTVSTGMHELGVEPHHVEAILNHVSGHKEGVAGRYNHAQYRAQMAQALARWADHVRSVVDGTPAKIVPLARAS
jgi:integrase